MVFAIIVSFLAGVTIVVSRSINALLANKTSTAASTFYNYGVGLVSALILLGAMWVVGKETIVISESVPFWAYWGGAVGVFVVSMLNVLVVRISSFYLTLLLFLGQVFAGVLLDSILQGDFSWARVIGGISVTIGLILNVWIDRKEKNVQKE